MLTDKKKLIDCTFLVADSADEKTTGLVIICKDNAHTKDILNEENQLLSDDTLCENQILLSEQKLRAVLNNSIGTTFLLDTFFRIILANEKAKKIVAYDGSVLKEGTYFPDILPQARREPVKKILDRVLKGEKVEYEIFYPKETGCGIWLQARYTPVKNNDHKINQICITAYNITSLKENEAALLKSEQLGSLPWMEPAMAYGNIIFKQKKFIILHYIKRCLDILKRSFRIMPMNGNQEYTLMIFIK